MSTWVYRLLLLMVFTLPLENVVSMPGVGRISKALGIVVALAWIADVATSGKIREPRLFHALTLIFVLWNGLSLMWTVDAPATQARTLTYLQLLVLVLVIWDTVTSLPQAHAVLTAYLAGAYVSASFMVVGYLSGSASHARVTLGNFNPNDVGTILALTVPFAAYLALQPGHGRLLVRRLVAISFIPLACFAVLITGSRGALLGLLPSLAYFGYMLARRHPTLAFGGVGALVALVVVALPLLPERVLVRFQGTQQDVASGSLNGRGAVWSDALAIMTDRPVFGAGSGAFRTAAIGTNKVGHNFALSLLAEIGVVGFGLFVGLFVTALLALRSQSTSMRGMWVALFVAWVGAASFRNWEYRKQTWFFLGLAVACGALQEFRATQTQLRPPRPRHAALARRS